MNYWKRVNLGDYKTYGPQVLQYFNTNPHKFWRPPLPNNYHHGTTLFWNALNQSFLADFLNKVPGLKEGSAKFGPINEVSVLVVNDDTVQLHIDHTSKLNAGVKARINVPLLNCDGSLTAFYEFTEEQYNQSVINSAGVRTWPRQWRRELTPVTSVELSEPTILRTSAPHTVFTDNCKYPRIVLTMSFVNDVVHYLDEECS